MLGTKLSALQTGHEVKRQSYTRPVSVPAECHLGKHRDAGCSKAPRAAEEAAATECCQSWAKAGTRPSQEREDYRNICWERYRRHHDTVSHTHLQSRVACCRCCPPSDIVYTVRWRCQEAGSKAVKLKCKPSFQISRAAEATILMKIELRNGKAPLCRQLSFRIV